MKVLFVRTPRYLWPFHSEKSSFWQPLGFASMAAVLREGFGDLPGIDGLDIKIVDCPVLKLGWKATERMIARERPDVICVGEETVSAHEAIRLVRFTRSLFPDCVVIAGGPHFTYMAEDTLRNHPVDFVVRFEGEITLLELIRHIHQGGAKDISSLKGIAGISFLHDGRLIETGFRQPLDMELLPFPAYDLLPMQAYGKGAHSHPDLVALEHSRGCTCSCNFCILWKQFGRFDASSGKLFPCYRSKSAKKSFEEVRLLAERYRRKTFCWVDPTWNTDPRWNSDFSRLMVDSGIDVDHSVWMRADFLVRDERSGIFKDQVSAGVRQVMVGVERPDDAGLAYFEKRGYSYSNTLEAFRILRKYSPVLSVATYIYGVPHETRKSLRRFYDQLEKIPFDLGIPIPITPNPGTRFFDELEEKGLLEVKSFRYYNFVNPIARSVHLRRNALLFYMLLNELRIRSRKEQFAAGRLRARRKTATMNVARSKKKMALRFIKGILQEEILRRPYNYNIRPSWYDR